MAGELIEAFGEELTEITMVRSKGGVFEVDVDGANVYSKNKTRRHAEPGEVVGNIGELLGGYDGAPGIALSSTQD